MSPFRALRLSEQTLGVNGRAGELGVADGVGDLGSNVEHLHSVPNVTVQGGQAVDETLGVEGGGGGLGGC